MPPFGEHIDPRAAPTDESPEGAGFATLQRAPLAVAGIVATHLANGFAEELAMRADLITRRRAATGSLAVALLLSNVAFTSYHVYYDASGITAVFGFGALLTAGWLVTRNLWVVALAHALFNLALEFL